MLVLLSVWICSPVGLLDKSLNTGLVILAALNVPKSDRLALAIIRELPEDAFGQLLAELERSPTSAPKIPNLSPDDAEAVFEAITSLHRVRAYNEIANDEFISDVCESLFENNDLPRPSEPKLRERLARILDIDVLSIAGKAVALHTEYENIYCSARILTDARPVYGKNVADPPAAMIITQTLKFNYHTGAGGRIAEFYVTLGSHDIVELREILERAVVKARSLGSVVANANIRLIDPQQ
jgi:hypothetical protein